MRNERSSLCYRMVCSASIFLSFCIITERVEILSGTVLYLQSYSLDFSFVYLSPIFSSHATTQTHDRENSRIIRSENRPTIEPELVIPSREKTLCFSNTDSMSPRLLRLTRRRDIDHLLAQLLECDSTIRNKSRRMD
jgi:hypothetical protein